MKDVSITLNLPLSTAFILPDSVCDDFHVENDVIHRVYLCFRIVPIVQ